MNKKELKDVLDHHSLWLDSDGEQGRRANLSRANLGGADLTEATLTAANLYGADLTEANLYGADLSGAELGPEIRECLNFAYARVSEDQLAWLCLHPRFSEWVDGLEIV